MLTDWIMKAFGIRRLVARLAIGATVAGLAIGAVKVVEHHFASKERASVQKKGEKTRAKAADARSAVERMPDVDRVLNAYCRDCKPGVR